MPPWNHLGKSSSCQITNQRFRCGEHRNPLFQNLCILRSGNSMTDHLVDDFFFSGDISLDYFEINIYSGSSSLHQNIHSFFRAYVNVYVCAHTCLNVHKFNRIYVTKICFKNICYRIHIFLYTHIYILPKCNGTTTLSYYAKRHT